jgi:NADH-quinone oxidoreductase subunit M
MIDSNHLLLQSIIAPLIASPIIIALGRRLGRMVGWIALTSLAYSLSCLLAVGYLVHMLGTPLQATYPWAQLLGDMILFFDGLSGPVALTVATVGLLACIYSVTYMDLRDGWGGYFSLYLLFNAGMLGTALSANLASFFLFLELILISSWLLIAVWGEKDRWRAALKYFLYTEAGALAILAGIGLTYSNMGTLNILELPSRAAGLSPDTLSLIASLMILGLFVKMAIFPFHSWLPDAHPAAPTPISAMLPAVIGIGGYAALRVIYTAFPQMMGQRGFMLTLLVLALVTIIYGGYLALAQNRLKRFLAYSSISQMGYMLLGIASASMIGLAGTVLIYVAHSLSKAALFMISGMLSRTLGTDNLNELGGLAGRMRATSIAFMIGFLSLMGYPPLLGFWSELFIFAGSIYTALHSSIDMPRLVLTIIAIIFSLITAGYGLWAVRRSLFGEESEAVRRAGAEPRLMLYPIIALAILLVILGVYPTMLTSLLKALAAFLPS